GATIYCIWIYPAAKNKSKAKLAIAACVLFNLFFIITAAFSYYIASNTFQKTKTILEDSRFKEPEILEKIQKKILSNDMTLDNKIEYSKIAASMVYKDTGKKINVVNEQNEIIEYEPTIEDKKLYSKTRKAISILDQTIESFKGAAILWTIVLVLSLIIGSVLAKRRKT
ncbi:MAG: hypothetical protein ACRENO_08760, partial [Thermodesulfobacteriota bacterium]